jgi:hypothetical protein
MTDDSSAPRDARPRPRYGEYAPEGWVSPVAEAAATREAELAARASSDPSPLASTTSGRAGVPGPRRTGVDLAAMSTGRRVDRAVTYGLIALGAFAVVRAIASVPRFAAIQVSGFREMGLVLDGLGSTDALQTVGLVSAVAAVVLFSVSLWWSLRRLRAGRVTFFVPLVAGVVFSLGQGIAGAVVLMSDPVFADALESYMGRLL